jgi:hypothetical protein
VTFLYYFAHVQSLNTGLRLHSTTAWRLVSKWEVLEPVQHRHPMPAALVEAMCYVALGWGWRRWAATTYLCFKAILRASEPIKATRGDLKLPEDLLRPGDATTYLHLRKTKSGRRGKGVMQHGKVSDRRATAFFEAVFRDLTKTELLYPGSPAVFRRRWDRLLREFGISAEIALTPGGLRGGGAVAAYHDDTPLPEILWRMRIKHLGTLESYLQEVAAASILPMLPAPVRERIAAASFLFRHTLDLLVI